MGELRTLGVNSNTVSLPISPGRRGPLDMEGALDCGDAFLNFFGSNRFSTYTSFSKTLENFQKATQTHYRPTSSTYFPTETVERQLIIYKYIRFACEMYRKPMIKNNVQNCGGTNCPAYFTVGSRNAQLGVVKYFMAHNHDCCCCIPATLHGDVVTDSVYEETTECDGIVDCSAIFEEVMQGKMFDTFHELQSKMDDFQRITGSLYAKRNTKRFPIDSQNANSLVYKSFAYECYHYGTHASDSNLQRIRRSAKIGCRSRIHVSCYRNQLKIVRYDVKHNHDVAPEQAKTYPRNRRLSRPQIEIVENMLQSTPENHVIKEYIESKLINCQDIHFLDNFKTDCTMTDIRNMRTRLKALAHTPIRPLQPPAPIQLNGGLEEEEEEDDDEEEEVIRREPNHHRLPLHSHLPPSPSNQVPDVLVEDLIDQVSPHLEHMQDLIISSPDQTAFQSRIKCLRRLVELWDAGKEAMVVAPQRRAVWTQNSAAAVVSSPQQSRIRTIRIRQIPSLLTTPPQPLRPHSDKESPQPTEEEDDEAMLSYPLHHQSHPAPDNHHHNFLH